MNDEELGVTVSGCSDTSESLPLSRSRMVVSAAISAVRLSRMQKRVCWKRSLSCVSRRKHKVIAQGDRVELQAVALELAFEREVSRRRTIAARAKAD